MLSAVPKGNNSLSNYFTRLSKTFNFFESTLCVAFPYNSICLDSAINSFSVVIIFLSSTNPYFNFSRPSGVYFVAFNFFELSGSGITAGELPKGFYTFLGPLPLGF